MAEETKVRVKLETEQAESALEKLVREGARSAGKVAGTVSSAVGKGLGMVGMGAGIATGLAAVRGATESGFGDVIGEAFGGIGAQLEKWLLGDLSIDAKASTAARNELIQNQAYAVGRQGVLTSAAKQSYDVLFQRQRHIATGQQIIESSEQFRKVSMDDIFTRLQKLFSELFQEAVDNLVSKLPSWMR